MEHPSYTLSALCLIGGGMGYIRKKSFPSLIAGGTLAILFGSAGYLLHKNSDYGLELAIGSSALLLAGGISRGLPVRFKKPVPVVLTTLGALSLAYYCKKYKEFY